MSKRTTQEQDRIRLIAEAMGWRPVNPDTGQVREGWFAIGDEADTWVDFDPFTDANDDYAVLEWMREQVRQDAGLSGEVDNNWHRSNKWWPAASILMGWHELRFYKVGDYARAALTVLGARSE